MYVHAPILQFLCILQHCVTSNEAFIMLRVTCTYHSQSGLLYAAKKRFRYFPTGIFQVSDELKNSIRLLEQRLLFCFGVGKRQEVMSVQQYRRRVSVPRAGHGTRLQPSRTRGIHPPKEKKTILDRKKKRFDDARYDTSFCLVCAFTGWAVCTYMWKNFGPCPRI